MRRLPAVSLSCILFATTAMGTFVPMRAGDDVEYLFVWPGDRRVLTVAAIIAVVLLVIYLLVWRAVSHRAPSRVADARSGWWLGPLTAVGIVALGILPAAPGIGTIAAPVGYPELALAKEPN